MLCSVWGQAICGGGPFTGCTAVPRLPSISAESAPGSDAGPVGCHWGSWDERLGWAAKGSSEDLGTAERRGCQVVSSGWGTNYHGIKGQGSNCLHRERWATVSLIPWFPGCNKKNLMYAQSRQAVWSVASRFTCHIWKYPTFPLVYVRVCLSNQISGYKTASETASKQHGLENTCGDWETDTITGHTSWPSS